MTVLLLTLVACGPATVTFPDNTVRSQAGRPDTDTDTGDTDTAEDTAGDTDTAGGTETGDPPDPDCPDLDEDGYNDAACGGSDCWDDPDVALVTDDGGVVMAIDIYPGATESWYDGVDQDCAGDDDYDQDGDDADCEPDDSTCGTSLAYGGGTDCDDDGDGRWTSLCTSSTADCDDADPEVNPDTPEDNTNGKDDNCIEGVDDFGIIVEWDVVRVDNQYVGTLTFRMTDDSIDDLKLYIGGDEVDISLMDYAESDAEYLGQLDVVRAGEVTNSNTQIDLDGQAPEDVTFLYRSQIGIASLGEYATSNGTVVPVGCAVWGANPDAVLTLDDPQSWHCAEVGAVDPRGDGNWAWDGL